MKDLATISHETSSVKRELEAVRLSIRNREAGLETDRATEAKLLEKLAALESDAKAVFSGIRGEPDGCRTCGAAIGQAHHPQCLGAETPQEADARVLLALDDTPALSVLGDPDAPTESNGRYS